MQLKLTTDPFAAMHFLPTLNRATNRTERYVHVTLDVDCKEYEKSIFNYEDFLKTKTPWKIIHKACISGKSHRYLIIWPCLWGHEWCFGGLHAIGPFPVEDSAITTVVSEMTVGEAMEKLYWKALLGIKNNKLISMVTSNLGWTDGKQTRESMPRGPKG